MRLDRGDRVYPRGTTVAARPELAGVIVADVLRPFAVFQEGRPDYRRVLIGYGILQDRVVREYGRRTLTFYQRLRQFWPPMPTVRAIYMGRTLSQFPTDIDFRLDGLGVLPLWGAEGTNHLGGYIEFELDYVPLADSTRWIFVRTDAIAFDENGETGVYMGTTRGAGWADFPSFQPLRVFWP